MSSGGTITLEPGQPFPDLDLPDHTGRPRLLSEVAGGDPVALVLFRGFWCPKEQRYMRALAGLQEEFEVAYARLVAVSVDSLEVQSAFGRVSVRASSSSWTPSVAGRGRSECSRPRTPSTGPTGRPSSRCFRVHAVYRGDWFWARATMEELRQDMRAITEEVREG